MLTVTYSSTVNPADITGDGSVDGADFGALAQKWKAESNISNEDLTADGVVDARDIGVVMSNYGN